MLSHEPLDVIPPASTAQLADDGEHGTSDRIIEPSRGISHVLTKSGFLVFSQLRLGPLR
jgi:hypothetical protein